MIEPNIHSLDLAIRDKYKDMSSAHVSLVTDIIMMLKHSTSRGRTYVDALDLINVVQRSISLVGKTNAK